MSRETRQEREKRLAEALRRNLARRKQAKRADAAEEPEDSRNDAAGARNVPETPKNPS